MLLRSTMMFCAMAVGTVATADVVALRATQHRQSLPQDPVPEVRGTRPTALPVRAFTVLLNGADVAAFLRDGDRPDHLFRVGETVHGARIERIARSLITLREGHALTYLEVQERPDLWCPPQAGCSVRRGALERFDPSGCRQGSSLRIVPDSRGGFRLLQISPASFAFMLGLRDGDRVLRINGIVLDSPEKLLGTCAALRAAPHLDVELERAGSAFHLALEVTD